MKKQVILMMILAAACVMTGCKGDPSLAGTWESGVARMVLDADGKCMYTAPSVKKEATYRVMGETLLLFFDDHGNTVIKKYTIRGKRLIGASEHWRGKSGSNVFVRKE